MDGSGMVIIKYTVVARCEAFRDSVTFASRGNLRIVIAPELSLNRCLGMYNILRLFRADVPFFVFQILPLLGNAFLFPC